MLVGKEKGRWLGDVECRLVGKGGGNSSGVSSLPGILAKEREIGAAG